MKDAAVVTSLVQIESPFAGDFERNILYARRAIRDSLMRGEAPFASHLLYTQPGVLDDTIPEQRRLGINAGHVFLAVMDRVAVYDDYGISRGMEEGIRLAEQLGLLIDFRRIGINKE